jgi:hypothetical protein
VLPITGGSSA